MGRLIHFGYLTYNVLFEGLAQTKSLFNSHNLNEITVYDVQFEGLGTD